MNIKPKMYALLIVDLMAKGELENAFKNFLKVLQKNGDVKKAKEIIRLAEAAYLKKTGKKKITIETARPIPNNALLQSFVNKDDVVEQIINSALVAGVKLTVNQERQIDFSLKNKLDSIFNAKI